MDWMSPFFSTAAPRWTYDILHEFASIIGWILFHLWKSSRLWGTSHHSIRTSPDPDGRRVCPGENNPSSYRLRTKCARAVAGCSPFPAWRTMSESSSPLTLSGHTSCQPRCGRKKAEFAILQRSMTNPNQKVNEKLGPYLVENCLSN